MTPANTIASALRRMLGLTITPPVRSAVSAPRFRPAVEHLEARDVPNVAPVFAPTTDRFIAPGQPFYAQAWATDADNQWLTYSANGLPQGLSINATTGTVTGTIPVGMYQVNQQFDVTYIANDGNGGVTDQAVTWTVTGAPNVWVVNTSADTHDINPGDGAPIDGDGKVSLRAAIEQANRDRQTSIPPTYITFNPTVFTNPTTINLTLGALPPITADLTIIGTGQNNVIIAGGGNQGVFAVGTPPPNGQPQPTPMLATAITNLTIQSGNNRADLARPGDGKGGAVENFWTAFLDGVHIRGCTANYGGAVYSAGSLTINNSQLVQNNAVLNGGAQGNGGGIDAASGHVTISGSALQKNTSALRGGGISIRSAAQFFLLNTDLIQNSAPGAGGVYNSGSWFQMDGGTMQQNQATAGDGGGILNSGTSLFLNMTFDTNSASGNGGAVNQTGMTCILTGCTFAGNNQATNGSKVAQQQGSTFTATNCTNFNPNTDIYLYGG